MKAADARGHDAADPRVRAQRRLGPDRLLDHGRVRRARSERARARRPLRLRRLLHRLGAQPAAGDAGGERRPRGRARGRPWLGSPVSFGEDGLCRVYVLSEGGQVFRLASTAPGPTTGCPAPAGAADDAAAARPRAHRPPPALVGGVRGTALQRLGAVLQSGFDGALPGERRRDLRRHRLRQRRHRPGARPAPEARPPHDARDLRARHGERRRGRRRDAAACASAPSPSASSAKRTRPFRAAVRLRAEVVAAGERTTATATIVLQRKA